MNNEQVRAAALEEAAQACESRCYAGSNNAAHADAEARACAEDIRALASSAAPERSGKLADDAVWRYEYLNGGDGWTTCYSADEPVMDEWKRNAVKFTRPAPEADSSSAAPSDLEIRVRKVLEGVHIETGRTEEFECVVANMVEAIGATAPTREGAWKTLADKAIAVLCRHIVPDGISDKEALSELYGIFDGPEYRAALDAPSPTGESLSAASVDTLVETYSNAWGKSFAAANQFDDVMPLDDDLREHIKAGVEAVIAALATPRQTEDGSGLSAAGWFVEIKHNDGSTTITSTRPEIDGAFQLFRPYVSGARPAPKETAVQGGVPEGVAKDADRWRFSMDWQDRSEQPEAILSMWRKVYAEHRLNPTRQEYEAAIDAALAAALAAAPTPPAPL